MTQTNHSQDDKQEIFSQKSLKVRPDRWSGRAIYLGGEFVVRERYRMNDGKIVHLVRDPSSGEFECTNCRDSWFLHGHFGGKRVVVHVFLDEVLSGNAGLEPTPVRALHLVVMPFALGVEMMERFQADEETSIQALTPWHEWLEWRAALDAIYDEKPWFDGPNPIDLTLEPVVVAFGRM